MHSTLRLALLATLLLASAYASAQTELTNVSTRAVVRTGPDVLIGGFVIGGSATKTVVVRARGPSLAPYGVVNPLANPALQLVRSSDQATIATNDDWATDANAPALIASGFAPTDPLEAAVLVALAPGAYTAIVTGAGGTTGVGIVEVFEVDHPDAPLVNLSTRGHVLTDNDVMIAGFVLHGSTPAPRTIIIRARGPSLAAQGISNYLANPVILVYRSSDRLIVGANDNWQADANASGISAAGLAPSDPLEAATMLTLAPDAYTVIVSGSGRGTGVAIVEVFAR